MNKSVKKREGNERLTSSGLDPSWLNFRPLRLRPLAVRPAVEFAPLQVFGSRVLVPLDVVVGGR